MPPDEAALVAPALEEAVAFWRSQRAVVEYLDVPELGTVTVSMDSHPIYLGLTSYSVTRTSTVVPPRERPERAPAGWGYAT